MHPAYKGLFDYDALKERSNQNYDQEDAALRSGPDGAGFNATMNIIGNQQNKQSPWAPYFQSLQEQAGPNARIDPRGMDVSTSTYADPGHSGEMSLQPAIAGLHAYTPQAEMPAINPGHFGAGLKGYEAPMPMSHENFMASLANRFGSLGR